MGSKSKIKALLPAAVLAATITGTSMTHAADLLVDPPVVAPEIITVAATGWYLRGDIGYNFNSIDKPEYSTLWGGTVPFATAAVDDGWQIGLGIGYQVTDTFRVDLTADYVGETAFLGTTVGFCDNLALLAGALNCTSREPTKYSAWKLLGNAYADLGNYSGFTPYVGAGIGGAYVKWKDLVSSTTCNGAIFACPAPPFAAPLGGTLTTTQGGMESWRFAWALHTGFSYDLAANTKLDVGYTYSRIEGGGMFQWANVGGGQGYDKGFDSHIIRAGLRYQIW